MASAMVSINLPGKRIDLSGDIPDDVAETIIMQITALLAAAPVQEPEQAQAVTE